MSRGPAFARMPVAVFGDRRLSVRDMRVLGVLYAHADAGGRCWPSVAAIADMTALDRRDVQRALRRLEAADWLWVRPGAGRGRASSYQLPPAAGERAGEPTADSEPEKAGRSAQKRRVDSREKAGGFTPKGRVASPARNRPGTNQEQTKEPTTARGRKVPGILTSDQQTRFDRFWAEYPRRVAKREAQKAWRQLAPDDALTDRICEAVRHARECDQWRRDGGRYIPHPATWLRRGSWDDEQTVRIDPLPEPSRGREAIRVGGTVTALKELFGETDGPSHVQQGDDVPVGGVWDGTLEGAGGGLLGPAGEPRGRVPDGGGEASRGSQPALPHGG